MSEVQVALRAIFAFQAVRVTNNLTSSFIFPSYLLHWRYSVPVFSRPLFAWRYVVQFRWRCLWSNHADRNDPSKPRTSFARQTYWRIASPRNGRFFPYIFPSGKKINLHKLFVVVTMNLLMFSCFADFSTAWGIFKIGRLPFATSNSRMFSSISFNAVFRQYQKNILKFNSPFSIFSM